MGNKPKNVENAEVENAGQTGTIAEKLARALKQREHTLKEREHKQAQLSIQELSSQDIQTVIENLKGINKKLSSIGELNALIEAISKGRLAKIYPNKYENIKPQAPDEITDEQLETFARIIFSPEIQKLDTKKYKDKRKKHAINSLKSIAKVFTPRSDNENTIRIKALTHIAQNAKSNKGISVTDYIKDNDILNQDFTHAIDKAEQYHLLPWNNEEVRSTTFKLIEQTAQGHKLEFVKALDTARNYLSITKLWKDPKLRNESINHLLQQIEERNEENRIKFLEQLTKALSKSEQLLSGDSKSKVFKFLIESRDPPTTSNVLNTLKQHSLLNKKNEKHLLSLDPYQRNDLFVAIENLNRSDLKNEKDFFSTLKEKRKPLFSFKTTKDKKKKLLEIILTSKNPIEMVAIVKGLHENNIELLERKSSIKILKNLSKLKDPIKDKEAGIFKVLDKKIPFQTDKEGKKFTHLNESINKFKFFGAPPPYSLFNVPPAKQSTQEEKPPPYKP